MNKERRRTSYGKTYPRSHYSYGSEAYKYYTDLDYGRRRNRTVTEKPEAKRTAYKLKKTKKHRTHYEFVKAKTGNFKVYSTIIVFFTFVILFVCMFALNSHKETEINSNLAELKRLEEENNNLKVELNKNINLEEIEKVAKTKLNMQKPATHQLVYINIPKQSYTIQYDNVSTEEKEEEFGLTSILNNLFGE